MCVNYFRLEMWALSQILKKWPTIQFTLTMHTVYHNSYANVYETFKIRGYILKSLQHDIVNVCHACNLKILSYYLPLPGWPEAWLDGWLAQARGGRLA